MTTKFTNTDPYPLSPDQMIDMLSNAEYTAAKYTALQDITFSVESQDRTPDALAFKVARSVNANLPDIAKKVLGAETALVQSENWRREGDSWVADVRIDNPGKPVAITAKFVIAPADGGSTWACDFEVKASVPLVGGKIEKIVADETKANLAKEFTFNLDWIANH